MFESKNGVLTKSLIKQYQDKFADNPVNRVALNAVTKMAITDISMNRDVLAGTDFTFSHTIKTGDITNQEKSGRCWMFAAMNTIRLEAMKKMNLETFELSQAYNFFWDKLERANYFLTNVIETCNENIHSRLVMWLLHSPLGDGGQWDMFVNLVKKYGMVPKSIMPETFNTSNTQHMNYFVTLKLREDAMILRKMAGKGARIAQLEAKKSELMKEIYQMLAIYMGEPPKEFVWQYRDKKGKFHRDPKPLTPTVFYNKYIGIDIEEMVSLINCPTKDKPYNRMYTLQYLGNVVGGNVVKYLNVDIDTLKKVTVDLVANGQPVWFGCDVGKMLYREGGIMHTRLFEYDKLLGTTFDMSKPERVDYGESAMTHAMVFTGVNLVDNKPTKWRVENSWGDKNGEKGFFVMDDEWFDEYLYQVVVPKKSLPSRLQKVLKEEPIVLPPWDPMGSLAIAY